MQKLQKSDMSLDYSSLGSEAKSHKNRYNEMENNATPEEYTKLLRRRMISEVLHKPQNNDVWQLQQNQSEVSNGRSRNHRETKRRPHRRSQSAQGRKTETQSEVNSVKPSSVRSANPSKPGLGRRSATQLEISRRKRGGEDETPMQKSKWHSQENLDTVSKDKLFSRLRPFILL